MSTPSSTSKSKRSIGMLFALIAILLISYWLFG